jgi:hypothetical protein
MGLFKLGTVGLDRTKLNATASKHRAPSFAHAERPEEQLKGEVEELLRPAEQAEYARKLAEREARRERTGRTPGGTPPKAPERGPRATDQVNLTDAESRIMPTAGGDFEQADNAQAGVDTETHLIVAQHLADHTNDKQEIGPALAADTGYDCQETLERCAAADSPRPAHAGRGHCASAAHPRRQGPLGQAQGHGRDRLRHHQARAGTTAQFLLRGLRAVRGAWALACPGWNLKRISALKG